MVKLSGGYICVSILVSIIICVHELFHDFLKCPLNFLFDCAGHLELCHWNLIENSGQSILQVEGEETYATWRVEIIVNGTGNESTYSKKITKKTKVHYLKLQEEFNIVWHSYWREEGVSELSTHVSEWEGSPQINSVCLINREVVIGLYYWEIGK